MLDSQENRILTVSAAAGQGRDPDKVGYFNTFVKRESCQRGLVAGVRCVPSLGSGKRCVPSVSRGLAPS